MSVSAPFAMKKLPVGIESFEKVMRGIGAPYYYVDKTMFLREIVSNSGKANLITRPQHFGKSLNLDMLRQFLSVDAAPTLFDGLEISKNREFCAKHQNQYLVLYFNMKDIRGTTFDEACCMFSRAIAGVMNRSFGFLKTSPRLSDADQYICKLYSDPRMWHGKNGKQGESLPITDLEESLESLSLYLWKHYQKKVVVLIDEYDAPLNAAWVNEKADPGYCGKMEDLLQNMLSGLLKGNSSLSFGVLTGSLMLAHNSIISGLNNLKVWDYNTQFDQEYFGFTESEVKTMLEYYGIPELFDTVREWYSGFSFGWDNLYTPLDVVKFVSNCIRPRPNRDPLLYWPNSSWDAILTGLLERSTTSLRQDYLKLINGESIEATVTQDVTLGDMRQVHNIWSFMVAVGYLTAISRRGDCWKLKVPNLEVRKLLERHLSRWMSSTTAENAEAMRALCSPFSAGDVD